MIEYIKLPKNTKVMVHCTLCQEKADYLIQYNKKKNSRQIYFYICEHCANFLIKNIESKNIKEKEIEMLQ